MTFERAAEILTWVDEPELIEMPGEPHPVFSASEVREARRVSEVASDAFRITFH